MIVKAFVHSKRRTAYWTADRSDFENADYLNGLHLLASSVASFLFKLLWISQRSDVTSVSVHHVSGVHTPQQLSCRHLCKKKQLRFTSFLQQTPSPYVCWVFYQLTETCGPPRLCTCINLVSGCGLKFNRFSFYLHQDEPPPHFFLEKTPCLAASQVSFTFSLALFSYLDSRADISPC